MSLRYVQLNCASKERHEQTNIILFHCRIYMQRV